MLIDFSNGYFRNEIGREKLLRKNTIKFFGAQQNGIGKNGISKEIGEYDTA